MIKKLIASLLIVFSLFLVAGCNTNDNPTEILLDDTSITLQVDETYQIDAKVDNEQTNAYFTYASNKTSVATVSENGLITAISVGEAIIRIKYGNAKASITITVVAQPTVPNTFTITFNSNGGSKVDSTEVEEGQTVAEPTQPTKDGFVFKGWWLNGSLYNFSTPVTDNITLFAEWDKVVVVPITYIVTFDSNGGTITTSQLVLSGENALQPINPTKEGFTFNGWLLNGTIYDFSTPVTDNITLVADWTKIQPTPPEPPTIMYTVTFNSNGGSNVSNAEVNAEQTVTKPTDPTRDGFIFNSWLYNGSAFDFSTPITSDITLVADWKEISLPPVVTPIYTVTFNTLGGNNIASQQVEEGQTVSKPTDPTREGFTFDGWTRNDAPFNFTTPITENITLYANWTKIPVFYTVTFDTNGGGAIASQQIEENGTATKPTDPTKKGYIFNGWTLDNTSFNFSSPINQSITLVASWQRDYNVDIEAPVITLSATANKKYVVYIGTSYDLFADVTATDDFDGTLTSSIQIDYGKFKDTVKGTYEITYYVSDNAGNIGELVRRVLVTEKVSTVQFIGHGGCNLGILNSELAFREAATTRDYDAIECDLRQTKDGVFILCHDETFNEYTLASNNWSTLKEVTLRARRQNEDMSYTYYTTELCTLETYLEICKQYNKKAVIELKYSAGINNNDTSRMDELMAEIKSADMLDSVIFLTSQTGCIKWLRNNGYSDIPCQKLVNTLVDELDFCLEWNTDISFNIAYTENTPALIKEFKDAGVGVACYTFTTDHNASELEKWIGYGVEYVTTDVHRKSQITNLPTTDNKDDYLYEYKLIFVDINGNVIEEQFVKEGYDATAPTAPILNGATFVEWNKILTNVTADMTVEPIYQIDQYSIIYNLNGGSCSTTLITTYNVTTETITLPPASSMSMTNGTFLGWKDKDGNILTQIAKGSYGDITLYAQWMVNDNYIFPLGSADENAINSLYQDTQQVASIIVNPTISSGTYVMNSNITGVSTGYQGVTYTYGTDLFSDLATALNNAVDGDIIYLFTATYSGEVVIDKTITLAGPNYNVNGNDTRADEANITGLTTINADGVEINGIKFSVDGAIKVGANNVTITNIYTTANQVACNGRNRKGCIVDSADISNLTVSNSYINIQQTLNSYTAQFMSFNNVTNLSIINNYISNSNVTSIADDQYAGMMIYTLSGTLTFKGNQFHWQTDGYLMRLGFESNTCTKIEFIENLFTGYGTVNTAGIQFETANTATNAVTSFIGNKFVNLSGYVINVNASDTSTYQFKYNYFDSNSKFYVYAKDVTPVITLECDHNCYLGGNHTYNKVAPNDTTTYSSQAQVENAYENYKNN